MPKKVNEIDFLNLESGEVERAIKGLPTEDTKILLYRVRLQGRPAYIRSYLVSDFSMDNIQENYGGGPFKIVVTQENEDDKTYNIELEGNPKIEGKVVTIRK